MDIQQISVSDEVTSMAYSYLYGCSDNAILYVSILEASSMNENIRFLLTLTIPALVTILGFIVAYFLNRRNLQEEISRQKTNVLLDKMSEMPSEIITMFNDLTQGQNQESLIDNFNKLVSKVFAYGSKDAILIAADMQEFNFTQNSDPNNLSRTNANKIMMYYILLLCQVKYDLTNIEISPECWCRIKFTDYSAIKPSLQLPNNEIVNKLQLKDFLRIK